MPVLERHPLLGIMPETNYVTPEMDAAWHLISSSHKVKSQIVFLGIEKMYMVSLTPSNIFNAMTQQIKIVFV